MNVCLRRLLGCALFALISAQAVQADILVIPGPRVVQLRAGQWDSHRLTARRVLIAPPEWGKVATPEAMGTLDHFPKARGEFRARVRLEKLQPNHPYILTLNGRPDLPGNALLPNPVPGLPAERYLDFLDVMTDASGNYATDVAVTLPPSPYQVRFYVKDRADFKIVLYADYFPFRVE